MYLMEKLKDSPKINSLSWGKIEVEGEDKPFKDAKLYPGGAREWDWRETGTEHVPGIEPADVEELISKGAAEVILSKGIYERLQVRSDTLQMLKDKGIPTHILQTEKAVELYNELRMKQAIGALIHSTC